MSLTGTVSGIVSTHLLRHAEWIEAEFSQLIKEVSSAQISGFPTEYIDAVTSAPSEAISDVVRTGGHADPRRLARLLKSVRSLLQFGRPSRDHVRRPSEKPRKVRGAGLGLGDSAIADIGPPEPGNAQQFGYGDTGPGDFGPEPELLKKAINEFSSALTREEASHLTKPTKGGREAPSGPSPKR